MVNIHSPPAGRRLPLCNGNFVSATIAVETFRIRRSLSSQSFERKHPLLSPIRTGRGQFDPNARGYHAAYREGEVNHCPGCGRSHWIVGRLSAECAFCATALPLSEARCQGQLATVVCRRWPVQPAFGAA